MFYSNGANAMVSATIGTTSSFTVRSQQILFTVPNCIQPHLGQQGFDVTKDDSEFLMIRSAYADGDAASSGASRERLIYVTNWFEELKEQIGKGAKLSRT